MREELENLMNSLLFDHENIGEKIKCLSDEEEKLCIDMINFCKNIDVSDYKNNPKTQSKVFCKIINVGKELRRVSKAHYILQEGIYEDNTEKYIDYIKHDVY